MKKLLPQANNLAMVIDVFIYYSYKKDCSIQDIASFCGFERRQAQYYFNACIYLGLVGEDNLLSDFGKELYVLNKDLIKRKIYEHILRDDLFGEVFAHLVLFPEDNIRDYCSRMLSTFYPKYGKSVLYRRAGTIISWCKETRDFVFKVNA